MFHDGGMSVDEFRGIRWLGSSVIEPSATEGMRASLMVKRESTASTATPDGVVRHTEVDEKFLGGHSWDGREYGYVPSARIQPDPSVQLHEEFDVDIDPITYQVLRYRFWNMNLEHGDVIKRICGSHIIVYTSDYNAWMLTENGDIVLGGPSIQYFVGMADLSVKWTLEHRSANPGIQEGDIFVHNDPWVASAHQQDTAVFAPFFWDGKLFCWFFSAAHQKDIGGTTPGSFCFDARDIYDEPLPWPPVKIVHGGKEQRDIGDLFSRQSRLPDATRLQLRSQFAGINACRKRMASIVDEFGPSTVKGAMRAQIRDASAAVSRRLFQIPDGSWDEVTYYGGKDRKLHPIRTTLRKEGDRLIFGNDGTAEQLPQSGNGTYCGFRSGALAAVGSLLAWDQLYTPGGVLNHLEFEPVPGTMSVANYPAAITLVIAPNFSLNQSCHALSKMLLSGPEELQQRATAMGGLSNCTYAAPFGIDAHGDLRFGALGDQMVGAVGASPDRDGVDTGGMWWSPQINGGNVEEVETELPMLFLYRREQAGSGGAGRYRGGNGVESAYIGHKAQTYSFTFFGNDASVNASPGISGGFPGRINTLGKAVTNIRDVLRSGRIPGTRSELLEAVGELDRLPSNSPLDITTEGVVIGEWQSGGGYGDPLKREPDAVAKDVREGRVPAETAHSVYGIVLTTKGDVDSSASERRRAEIRKERLEHAVPPQPDRRLLEPDLVLEVVRPVLDGLALGRADVGYLWVCTDCNHVIGDASRNYREGCALLTESPQDLDGMLYPDPTSFLDDDAMEFRRWLCPNCAQQIAMEAARSGDDPVFDIRLDLAGRLESD